MKLVGKQDISFNDRESGQLIEGVKLHLVGIDQRVQGESVLTQFIRKDNPLYPVAKDCPFGEVVIEYGPRGSVQGIYPKK